MKKVWIGIAAALVTLAIAGGSFWGGMRYARSRATQAADQFFQGGFGNRTGQFPGGQLPEVFMTRQAGRGDVTPLGEGVMGTIQSIEGQTLVINTSQGTIRVQTTDTTLIQKVMPVSVDDLELDEQVVVLGRENDDGSITARSIQPLRAPQFGQRTGGE
jgi:hypothetical protein